MNGLVDVDEVRGEVDKALHQATLAGGAAAVGADTDDRTFGVFDVDDEDDEGSG